MLMVSTRLETAALRRRICRLCGLSGFETGPLPTLHRTFIRSLNLLGKMESSVISGVKCIFHEGVTVFIEDHMSLKYQRVLQGLDTIHPFAKASLHLPASLPLPPSLSHTHTHPPTQTSLVCYRPLQPQHIRKTQTNFLANPVTVLFTTLARGHLTKLPHPQPKWLQALPLHRAFSPLCSEGHKGSQSMT